MLEFSFCQVETRKDGWETGTERDREWIEIKSAGERDKMRERGGERERWRRWREGYRGEIGTVKK